MRFLVQISGEQDPEVQEEVQGFFEAGNITRDAILLEETDLCKFKEGADPETIMRFLDWAAKGMMQDMELMENVEKIDELVGEFYKLLDFMRATFYKEEYL